jgi:hypothetical protein
MALSAERAWDGKRHSFPGEVSEVNTASSSRSSVSLNHVPALGWAFPRSRLSGYRDRQFKYFLSPLGHLPLTRHIG